MDLCLDLELSMEIIQQFFSLKFGPNNNKFCLARTLPSSPTHPLTDVATSQEIPLHLKLIETCKFEYHRHKDGGLCQN